MTRRLFLVQRERLLVDFNRVTIHENVSRFERDGVKLQLEIGRPGGRRGPIVTTTELVTQNPVDVAIKYVNLPDLIAKFQALSNFRSQGGSVGDFRKLLCDLMR